MYQGLGQMLTKCLQHHQGCPETPKSADVICERPLRSFQKYRCPSWGTLVSVTPGSSPLPVAVLYCTVLYCTVLTSPVAVLPAPDRVLAVHLHMLPQAAHWLEEEREDVTINDDQCRPLFSAKVERPTDIYNTSKSQYQLENNSESFFPKV